MSNSEGQAPEFRLSVRATQRNGRDSDGHVVVLDAWDRIRASGEGSVAVALPKGLYSVRVARGGAMDEHVVRHDADQEIEYPEPLRVSAVPSFDTATAHEYYSYTSHDLSKETTRGPFGSGDHGGRVFVFLRAVSSEHYNGENLAENLVLTGPDGDGTDFSVGETARDASGWLGLSAKAAPGVYMLRYDGPDPRQMPIHVFEGYSTQLFATWHSHLRLASASILMPRAEDPFDPGDRETQAADAALKGIMLGRDDAVPGRWLMSLLYGKFGNPMFGLLGAHILLLQRELEEPERIEDVLHNMERLLPRSPDVQALWRIAARRFDLEVPEGQIEQPPMVRAGFEAIMSEAAADDALLAEGSILEAVAPRLLADSPWTSWEPFEMSPAAAPTAVPIEIVEPVWLQNYLGEIAHRAIATEQEINLDRIAEQVSLPVSSVERGFSEVVKAPEARELFTSNKILFTRGKKGSSALVSFDPFEPLDLLQSTEVEDVERDDLPEADIDPEVDAD